ncbi:MAG: response regulator [Planctomycetota bacterium]|nr:response regulator [Planctomycetota bacterium]
MSDEEQTVFMVNDEPLVLTALARLLRAAGLSVRTFSSAVDFLESYGPDHAGCLLLDMAMPGLDGLSLQRQLKSRGIGLPVIFLTARADVPMTVQAMKEGAADFLTKPPSKEQLLGAVRAALAKDAQRRLACVVQAEDRRRLASLTPREREVFEHVVRGQLNKQIAADLGTVERTVKFHRAALMEKLGVESVADLVRFAQRLGIDPAEPGA